MLKYQAVTNEQMPFTTVLQKLNRRTLPKTGCYPCPTASFRRGFRVAFFVSFLAKQKRNNVLNVKLQGIFINE